MANEVIKETEESNAIETSVVEETNNQATETVAETDDDNQNVGEDFGAILEKFEQDQTIYYSGEMVTGKVIGVSERGVMVDFGYKSEGIVPLEEFTAAEGEITVKQGDSVQVVIRNIHTGDAPPQLSRFDALRRAAWDEIETAFREERPITAKVVGKTKGGLRLDINGVEAFMPGSQIDSRQIRGLDNYIGQDIEGQIIKCSRKRDNVVLSRKILTDAIVNEQKAATLGSIEEGFIIEGTIKNLTEYGAFVDIGGIDGLLHVTDMSWNKQQNPGHLFKSGENVQVKILKLDREKEKISLGYKQLIPNPWITATELYPVGSRVKGKISTVTDYGAFIQLESNIEGLVHISEMSWSKRTKSPKKFLKEGEEIEVQVLGIDSEEHRISLGMKQLMVNPWETIRERYHVGDRIHGKVRNITDFGAFVEVEDGVDGLVHVSDISWSKKLKHAKDVLSRDQEVDAIITGIDVPGRRMSLSIKDITPSAWEAFVAIHKSGDVVRGKVTRIAEFGVFVELGEDLEGLCHISELSDDRIEKPGEVVKVGQELDFRILRVEYENRKIGLSARAAGGDKDSEGSSSESRGSYTSEAKGGMASLGELAKLKFGRSDEVPAEEEKPRLSKKERKALKMQERADAADADGNEPEATEEIVETADEISAETSEVAENTSETTETETTETETTETETAETETTETETTETETAETETAETETTETAAEAIVAEDIVETTEAAVEETVSETAETAVEEIVSENTSEMADTVIEETVSENTSEDAVTTAEEIAEEVPALTETENEATLATDSATEVETAETDTEEEKSANS